MNEQTKAKTPSDTRSLIDDLDYIVENVIQLRRENNYTLIAARHKLAQLQTDNERLRQALESATNWLETAAMGCDQCGSQYVDAAWRARKVLNGGDDDE